MYSDKDGAMRDADISRVVGLLRKRLRSLKVPYLDELVSARRDPFKVLVSCILSLRTQDRTTAEASERLYKLAETPKGIAALPERTISKAIYPVGFYRTKAKTLKALGETIAGQYGGIVPDTVDELLKLKGVGRKTANLVVTLGWDKPGICVDTHVHRITNRWGYVKTRTPEQTEFALRGKLPRRHWKEINGILVAFGQHICKPVSPLCSDCPIAGYCPRRGVTKSR